MAEKTIKTRIVHKHAIESNWKKATNFSPKLGELIVYDPDDNHGYSRYKIGDGTTNVNDLQFLFAGQQVIEGKSVSYTDKDGATKTVTIGRGAEIFNNYDDNVASGMYAHAEGYRTFAIGGGSHAEGTRAYQLLTNKQSTQSKITNISSDKKTITISPVPTNAKDEPVIKAGLEISFNLSNGTRTNDYKVASFNNSTGVIVLSSAVKETISNGLTLSLLLSNYALEEGSHVEGGGNVAAGDGAHAEGSMNIASGESSHAEGKMGFSEGMGSHSEGYQTISSGTGSHSEGYSTVSSAMAAHAEGGVTTAKGMASHAEGVNTIAAAEAQHAQGKFNIEDTTSAHIVGNGVKNARSNAHTLDWDGNAWFAGDVYVGSTSGTNKDAGSKKLVTEDELTFYVNMAVAEGIESPDPEMVMLECDKTYEQVAEAYNAGRSVYAKLTTEGGTTILTLPLTGFGDGQAMFLIYTGAETLTAIMGTDLGNYAMMMDDTSVSYHIDSMDNPHNVTAAQVGAPTIAEMQNKLDKTGGTIDGNLEITGYTEDNGTEIDNGLIIGNTKYGPGGIFANNGENMSVFNTHMSTINLVGREASIVLANSTSGGDIIALTNSGADCSLEFSSTSGNYVGKVSGLANATTDSEAVPYGQVNTLLNNKVDKVSGKGLSTNDYTTNEKTKLSGIEAGAQKNTITGVKGSAESSYRTGNVNITAANVGAYTKAETDNAITAAKNELLGTEQLVGTYDTLKEIGAWIQNSGVDATELSSAIAAEAKTRANEDAKKLDKEGYDPLIISGQLETIDDNGYGHDCGIDTIVEAGAISFNDYGCEEAIGKISGLANATEDDQAVPYGQMKESLPYELELGEPIISNVTLATDGQYDAAGITLNEGDMYWLDVEHIYTDSPSDRKQIVSRAIDDGNDIIINWNREFQLNSEFFGVFITQENIDSVKINSLCKVLKFEKKNVPFGDMEGTDCIASGADAHVEGFQTQATNWNAHAEGRGTLASGVNAHAEGRMTTASAAGCHSEGYNTTASGTYGAHAEGYHTLASGKYGAHAEGQNTKATTASSHAEGNGTKASGFASHAEGDNTIAASRAQHVEGRYNIEDTENKYAHIVGNGEQELPNNAHTLGWDGKAWFAGDVYVGGGGIDDEAAVKLATMNDLNNSGSVNVSDIINDIQDAPETLFLSVRGGQNQLEYSTYREINLIEEASYNSSSKVYSVLFGTLNDVDAEDLNENHVGMEVTIIPKATNGDSARLCVNGSNNGRGHIIYLSTCVGTGGYKAIPAGYLKAGMPVRMKFTGSGWRITDYMYMPTWDDFNALLARVEALEAGGANNTFRIINDPVDSYQDFEYEKNMTWYDFVESEFNNTGEHFEIKEGPEYEVLVFVGDGGNFPEGAYLVGSDAGEVLPEHLISMYSEYYITDSYDEIYGGGGTETSFEFEGEEYSFESGMTWDEYINSDYNTEHECSDGCGNTYKEFSDPYAEGYVHYSWTCPHCGGEPYTLYNSDGGLVSTDDRVRSGGSYTTSEEA